MANGAALFPLFLLMSFVSISILNSINPMLHAFLFDFRVLNQSGVRIVVTPVGTVGKGYRNNLPMYATRKPAIMGLRSNRFVIENGQFRVFIFDWDDINFSEIAVEGPDGIIREYIVDPTPTKRQYHSPEKDVFTIGSLDELPKARKKVAEVHTEDPQSSLLMLFLTQPILLSSFIWIRWRLSLAGKRLKIS